MSLLSKLTQENLIKQLATIGLRETDALVYLTSLQLGACTIGQLTAQTDRNRITVHDSVARLIEKGLLLETFSGHRRLIFPQQITILQNLVEHKKIQLEQLQNNVSSTIALLQSVQMESHFLPRVRISKGQEGIRLMMSEIRDDEDDVVYVISDSRHFDELLNIQFLETMAGQHKKISLLTPPGFEHFVFSAQAKGVSINQFTLQESSTRKGGMTLWGNKVALHAYEGIYITTTIIENHAIVQMMKSLWDSMRQASLL